MKTTVEKFKALLKAKRISDLNKLLEKCTFDEMKKFAAVLKLDIEEISRSCMYWGQVEIGLVSEIITTLDTRRFHKKLARKWSKKAAKERRN